MKKTLAVALMTGALTLSACASNDEPLAAAGSSAVVEPTTTEVVAETPRTCRDVGKTALTGAAVGGAAGLGVGAVSNVGLLEGAIVGAVVGGLAGAIWADADNDGCVDGYTRDGTYYPGAPGAYQPAPLPAERG